MGDVTGYYIKTSLTTRPDFLYKRHITFCLNCVINNNVTGENMKPVLDVTIFSESYNFTTAVLNVFGYIHI